MNGQLRKARIVLQTADALFRNRKNHFSIACDTCRRVVHLRVVDPKREHVSRPLVICHGDLWMGLLPYDIVPERFLSRRCQGSLGTGRRMKESNGCSVQNDRRPALVVLS